MVGLDAGQLLKLSYALDWWRSPTAAGFHATNLCLHGLNAILAWAVSRQWLARLAPGLPAPGAAAWCVALLCALHPAATEAVTWEISRAAARAAASAWRRMATLSALGTSSGSTLTG